LRGSLRKAQELIGSDTPDGMFRAMHEDISKLCRRADTQFLRIPGATYNWLQLAPEIRSATTPATTADVLATIQNGGLSSQGLARIRDALDAQGTGT